MTLDEKHRHLQNCICDVLHRNGPLTYDQLDSRFYGQSTVEVGKALTELVKVGEVNFRFSEDGCLYYSVEDDGAYSLNG